LAKVTGEVLDCESVENHADITGYLINGHKLETALICV